MAVRTRVVHPQQMDESGTPRVDPQQILDELSSFVALQDVAGGVINVVVNRAATDMPGEMVTTHAVIRWSDRTDAKPQPETENALGMFTVEPDNEPAQEPDERADDPELVAVGDAGFEGEDLSSIPEEQR